MGFFSKIKNTAGEIAKNPTKIRNYADLGAQALTFGQVDTHGLNNSAFGMGKDLSIDEILLGKKAKDITPDEIANQIRATQSKGLGELNSALDTPAEDIVRQQSDIAKKSILASAQDARRNAQKMMAQNGLQNSSLGLAANRSITRDAGNDLASIYSAIPGQLRNQKIQDASTRIGLGGMNQNGINFNTIEGARSGGLLGYAAQVAPMAGSIGQLMSGTAAIKRANAGGY